MKENAGGTPFAKGVPPAPPPRKLLNYARRGGIVTGMGRITDMDWTREKGTVSRLRRQYVEGPAVTFFRREVFFSGITDERLCQYCWNIPGHHGKEFRANWQKLQSISTAGSAITQDEDPLTLSPSPILGARGLPVLRFRR